MFKLTNSINIFYIQTHTGCKMNAVEAANIWTNNYLPYTVWFWLYNPTVEFIIARSLLQKICYNAMLCSHKFEQTIFARLPN